MLFPFSEFGILPAKDAFPHVESRGLYAHRWRRMDTGDEISVVYHIHSVETGYKVTTCKVISSVN